MPFRPRRWQRCRPGCAGAIPDAQSLAGKDVEEVALADGAAIGALDAVVRRQERRAGAWRQRLAHSAAAVTAKRAGRVEEESALRDAVLLTSPGDNVGPAGRLLLAWRRLAGTPAEKLLTEASVGAVLDDLGFARNDEGASDLTDNLRQLAASDGTAGMMTGAIAMPNATAWGASLEPGSPTSCWRNGWVGQTRCRCWAPKRARPHRSAATSVATRIVTDPERAKGLLAAQARAALRAIDLHAELGRRADRLLAVTPKLRAKAADAVVDKLLSDDAIVASEKIAGMSDRGLRRLFDRLVELGAVRELSGRPTFRIYGL